MAEQERESQLQMLKELKKAYNARFQGKDGQLVLDDIKRHCFLNDTTYQGDRDEMLINEGMRRVALHIENMMNLDIEKIEKLNRGGE